MKLLKNWIEINELQLFQSRLGFQLVEDMQIVLKKFIETGEKSDAMRNNLLLAMEKNNRLFDREINKIRGE